MQFEKKDTQATKGIAIIMLIMHHCFLAPERYEGKIVDFNPFSENTINYVALSMKICVGLFTFLSAYGITMTFKSRYPNLQIEPEGINAILRKRLVSLVGNFVFVFILVNFYDIFIVRDDRYHFIYGHGPISLLRFVIDGLGLAEMFGFPTYLATFWYMSLAIIVIICMPLLILIYNTIGGVVLLFLSMIFSMLFPVTEATSYAFLPHYLFCVSCGIVCAKQNVLASVADMSVIHVKGLDRGLKIVALCMLTLALVYFRQSTRHTTLLPFWDGIIPILICALTKEISSIPAIGVPLRFLGKHSMNIFLIHNFIRIVWYYDFTYSFKKWWLIVLVLLGISVIVSILIEGMKTMIRYRDLLSYFWSNPKTDMTS